MIKGLVFLLSIAIITAVTVNHLASQGIAIAGNWDARKGTVTARSKNDSVVPDREIREIETVKSVYDKKEALFLDARSTSEFSAGHIPGAVSIPAGTGRGKLEAFSIQYHRDTRIITYCSGRECNDSHHLAEMLEDIGYTKVQVLLDGFPAWKERGYPIE